MLLLIDLGNTTVNVGIAAPNGAIQSAYFPTKRNDTPDACAVTLLNALALRGADKAAIRGAALSSVVPSLTAAFVRAVEAVCGVTPVVVGPGVKTGLNIKIDDPAQLGADMVATAVGAAARFTLPCLIYDLGTATKISVLATDGRFLGGVICPGVGVSLDALGSAAALLPNIGLGAPKSVIGQNTIDCMNAGIIYGTAGSLDALGDRIEEELGAAASHVATGGMAAAVIPHCKRMIEYAPNLIFEGLRIVYERNK